MARRVLGVELSDPMTGFFAIRRETFEKSVRNLSQLGFKILLDIVVSSPVPPRVEEFPYRFRVRERGESKLDAAVIWDFLLLLIDKRVGHILPARFVSFSLIRTSGVAVHLATMMLLFSVLSAPYVLAHTIGTVTAMTWNYLLNNALTFQDRRRTGWGLVTGWISFAIVCSVGMLGNVGIANWLYERHNAWIVSTIAGILAGVVWNYSVSSFVTWRTRAPQRKVDF
jgi:dolichol-phosphate mannosyltransferase